MTNTGVVTISKNKQNKTLPFLISNHMYEVYDSKNNRVLFTDDLACVDSQQRINVLAKSGHKFKVYGKMTTKNKILETIKGKQKNSE